MAEVLVFTGSLEGLKVSVRVPVICAHPSRGRLHRRLTQIEQMPPKVKRQVLSVLDTFLERQRLRKLVSAG